MIRTQTVNLRCLHNVMPIDRKRVLTVINVPETEQGHIQAYMTRRDSAVILD
jgi:hypothetical protein